MRLLALVFTFVVAVGVGARASDVREEAKEQVRFGIEVAQHNLWREAVAKFERAADIDPTYQAAWNNLAIAYEQQGDLEKARSAYEKALKIDPDNQYARQNYELFKEIYDRPSRQKRR